MDDLIPTFLDRVSMYWQTLSAPAENGKGIPQAVLERFAFNAPRDFLPGGPAGDVLDEVIRKTQDYFLRTQRPDGYWVGELEADATLTADYILLMHFLGEVDEREQQRAARYLLKKQLADGGWNIYANGPSEVSASVKAYFALKLAGYSPEDPFMQKARLCILGLGGVMKCNAFTKIYLAIFGQLDWKWAPATPAEMMLFPSIFPFNIYEMSYWSRCIVVPLTIVSARGSGVKVAVNIDELYTVPRGQARDDIRRDQRLTWRNFFINADWFFKRYDRHHIGFLRRWAVERAVTWVLARVEKSGGLGAIWPGIINTIFALKALGYPNDHPQVRRALQEVQLLKIEDEDSLHMQPCVSPVWDTGWAVIALHDSGLPRNHQALVRAGEWLLTKEVREYGDWRLKCPNVEPSGWYFEYDNEWYPDTDDSAVVLMGLQRAVLPQAGKKAETLLRGTRWLLGMQCADGGWGAFDRDNNRKVFNHIPVADFGALLDPSTSDVTGRCLDWLGRVGFGLSHPAVQKAVEFLRSEQETDGSWFGRWGCNYVYGTWSVLSGLASVGEDVRGNYIRHAADWLKGVQLGDGGWGERCDSYEDPGRKGKGPSTPSQTAWAIMGLLAAGEADSSEVKKGIEYLVRTQKADGTWAEEEFTATGFPRFFYLEYHEYRNYFPLMAMSRYRNLCRQNQAKKVTVDSEIC
ncbi:MAG TPA: squalene--hopene cyclase [Candidatus Tripitaka californicus]|uniref:squalene--hopene cyclase n=1 Tax=Candidatus Tripitaka californicus TaxID=3367616 RepID=UPI0040299587